MSSTLATGAYRRAVDRAHESLDSVRLSLAPSSSTAPTGADQGLRAALQGLRREVRESWLRSLGALTPAGSALDAGAAATAPAVPGQTDPATLADDDLAAARREQRLAVALPVVRRMLIHPAAEAGMLAAIGNARGHLLWVEGDRTAVRHAETMGFVAGADWSEASMGTSAPGIVLATGAPTQVSRGEHLSPRVHPWSCSAVPLTDPATGRLVGVLDLTGGEDAVSHLALPLLQATVDAVHAAWRDLPAPSRGRPRGTVPTPGPSAPPSASPGPSPAGAPHRHDEAAGLLRVTGHLPPTLDGVELTGRHAEILTLLAWHGPGLTGAELEIALYPEETAGPRSAPGDAPARAISLRAEVHRLRRALQDVGAPVELLSRPYRLVGEVHADLLCAREALRAGDLDRALHAAAGPVLPRSASPGVASIRAELGEALREAVAQDADVEQLWAYLGRPEARDDVELWGAALRLLPTDSPRRALAVATLERIERDLA